MSKIKWYKINDSHQKHFVGTDSYLAHVTEYGADSLNDKVRAVVDFPGAPVYKEVEWFDDVASAKEWAISVLTEHAKVAIAEANKSISAAQAFLGLVEGQEGANE